MPTSGTVAVWKISLSSKAESDNNEFHRVQVMRTGHRAPICSLAVSSAYAVAVSGDEAGRAMLWDTNRYFVRDSPEVDQRSHADTDEDKITQALRHLDNDEAVSAVAIVSGGLSSLSPSPCPHADIWPGRYRATRPATWRPVAGTCFVCGMSTGDLSPSARRAPRRRPFPPSLGASYVLLMAMLRKYLSLIPPLRM